MYNSQCRTPYLFTAAIFIFNAFTIKSRHNRREMFYKDLFLKIFTEKYKVKVFFFKEVPH